MNQKIESVKREPTKIEGASKCRNIRFVLLWPGTESTISARACSCSFCQAHAGVWTAHQDSKLVVEIVDMASVLIRQFGTRTADFYVCFGCGDIPFAKSEIDGRYYAAVNVNTFKNIGSLSFTSASTNFDGEDLSSRLARRKRNWIPDIQIGAPAV